MKRPHYVNEWEQNDKYEMTKKNEKKMKTVVGGKKKGKEKRVRY